MAQLSTKVKLYLESKGKTYESESGNFYLIDTGSGPEIGMWNVDGVTHPTKSELDALESAGNTEDESTLISGKRRREYPDIRDQFDLLYHDMVSGKGNKTGKWFKAVKKVKDNNPKG